MAKIIHNEELDAEALSKLSKDYKEWIYNALDVCVTYEVHDRQLESADATALATYNFSRALSVPILEMNMRGVRIDLYKRNQIVEEFRKKLARLEASFERIVCDGIGLARPFNWRSNKQLMFLFYRVMQLKEVKARNAAGVWAPTVNRDAIERLSQYYSAGPLCNYIMLMRELSKKIDFLTKEIDEDKRLRTSYNIAGTNTGRLSSSTSDWGTGGNQQNIERALREMFIPDEGMKFCNIDLEQADARHVGAICWELFIDKYGPEFAGTYLDACESGDLHTTVCRMAWPDLDWPESKADWRAVADGTWYRTFSYRDGSKKLGHGSNYYGTPPTMAMHAKVDRKQIEEFQVKYFSGFPAIGAVKYVPDARGTPHLVKDLHADNWHNWVRDQLVQFGYITTPFYNRRRYFFSRPEDLSTLREAIAYAPQSMTADAIDTGIIRLWDWGKVQLLIQVHDSILFQFPAELESEIVPAAVKLCEVQHTLKHGRPFYVPAEAKVGWNWADASSKNPTGLIKWKGVSDNRPRPKLQSIGRSFKDLLNV